MLMMVTMKLKAAASEAMPRIWRLTSQKSMPWPGVKGLSSNGRVAEPSGVWRSAQKPAEVEHDGAGQEGPVAEGVEPGEGNVSGAYLQGHYVVEESGTHWHDRQEYHRGAVHGE